MQAKKDIKKHLTSTAKERTVYAFGRLLLLMDATTKKIIAKLSALRRQINDLTREAQSLERTLEMVGIKPELADDVYLGITCDARYFNLQPFSRTTLVEACRTILIDNAGRHLTKSQVEYFASMGGYQFSTTDPKNSVDVTLRRLAADGFCKLQKGAGPHESEYWWESPVEVKEKP
jgi:hypothetical protein